MVRNKIKIVCNPHSGNIAYYFKNELDEWTVLSGNSPLSRQYYVNTSLQDRANDIVAKLDEVYNRKNRGLKIVFNGPQESYIALKNTLLHNYSNKDICCISDSVKIAVIGKEESGKTCLIQGLQTLLAVPYHEEQYSSYILYADEQNITNWYELSKIDENTIFNTLKTIEHEGLTGIIYCISAKLGRIYDDEKDFIVSLLNEYTGIPVMVALTMCYTDDTQYFEDEIKKAAYQVKTFQVLAKKYNTGRINPSTGEPIEIEPFGLDEMARYIFEER